LLELRQGFDRPTGSEADGIRLQPANPSMEPIYLRHEELQILGVVAGVIRLENRV